MNNNSGKPDIVVPLPVINDIMKLVENQSIPIYDPVYSRIVLHEDSEAMSFNYTIMRQPPKIDFMHDSMEFCKEICDGMDAVKDNIHKQITEQLLEEMQEARLAAVEALSKLAWLHGSYQLALLDIVGDLYNFNTEKGEKL